MGWWPVRGDPIPSPQVWPWFHCQCQEVAPLPRPHRHPRAGAVLLQHPPGPASLCPELHLPTREVPVGLATSAGTLFFPPYCCLLQPPTRRSPRWLCPRSQWRLGAAIRSHCTSGSKRQPCPGHAAIPLWPGQGTHRTYWRRRPPALLGPRTNLSSESSLGRRSESHSGRKKAVACPLSSPRVPFWHSLHSQHQLTAHHLPGVKSCSKWLCSSQPRGCTAPQPPQPPASAWC